MKSLRYRLPVAFFLALGVAATAVATAEDWNYAVSSGHRIDCIDRYGWWEYAYLSATIEFAGETHCNSEIELVEGSLSMRDFTGTLVYSEAAVTYSNPRHGSVDGHGQWTAVSGLGPPVYGNIYAVHYEIVIDLVEAGYYWQVVPPECEIMDDPGYTGSNDRRRRTCEFRDSKFFLPGEGQAVGNSIRPLVHTVASVAVFDAQFYVGGDFVCHAEDNPGCIYGTTPAVWVEEAVTTGTNNPDPVDHVVAGICFVLAPGAVKTVVDVCDARPAEGGIFGVELHPGASLEATGPLASAAAVGAGFFSSNHVEICVRGHALYLDKDNPQGELVEFASEEVCRPVTERHVTLPVI